MDPPCLTGPPGGAFAAEIVCQAMRVDTDARIGDVLLGNDRFRAVIRHPNASLSAIGVGGGTLVAAGPWERADELLEAIPLVGGGWMEVGGWELLADGVRVHGVSRGLPDTPADAPGSPVEVTWRVDPDAPVLHADGADALWMFPRVSAVPTALGWFGEGTAFLPVDAGLPEDARGAVRLPGASLRVVPTEAAFDGERAAGTAPGADTLEVVGPAGVLVALPIHGEVFDRTLPPEAIAVRTVGRGAVPSAAVPPGPALHLPVGPSGAVHVVPGLRAEPGWTRASWVGLRGPDVMAVPPEGAWVPVGPGFRTLTLSRGPDAEARVFEVNGSDRPTVPSTLPPAFAVGSRVLVSADVLGERSRTAGVSDRQALESAAADGLDWVVLAGEDAVAGTLDDAPILHASGVLTTVGEPGVVSWSWPSRAHQAGWGAPDPRGLGLSDALALLGDRQIVDVERLAALGPPPGWDPAPFAVRLPPPDDALDVWSPWFEALDAGKWVVPWGPLLWVDVPDPGRLGQADVAQALARGNLCATTGPLVVLAVGGSGPGEPASLGPDGATARIEVGWAGPVDRVRLVGPGPTVLAEWTDVDGPVETGVSAGAWWVAVMESGDHWAVTAPVPGVGGP